MPQNPKSKIRNPNSKLQNPKSKIRNPKSKIQNPKSKIQNPKSKIRNPKSKIQNPKSKIQNPKSKIQNPKSKFQNPKSEIQIPKSKIRNPKSKFQNPKLGHRRLHKKNCYIAFQNPKSKFQNPKSPKSGRKSLDFGFWIGEFWILDSGFWILDSGFWILDLGFWILEGSRECTTRQFGDGAPWSQARIPPGPPHPAAERRKRYTRMPSTQQNKRKTLRRCNFFLLRYFSQPEPSTTEPFGVTNQNLPEAYSSRRSKKTNPKLKTLKSRHLNEIL